MSFAIAEYDNKGRDIVLAADRRWTRLNDGSLEIDDSGLKCIDLSRNTAVAFTGHAEVMAKIIAELYEDSSLAEAPEKDCLKRLLQRESHHLPMSTLEIARHLDQIIPKQRTLSGELLDVSAILAGRVRRRPMMYFWSKERKWAGEANSYGQSSRVRSLPKEAPIGSEIQKGIDNILDSRRGTVAGRIDKTIAFLERHSEVQSVGGGCVLLRLSHGFRCQLTAA